MVVIGIKVEDSFCFFLRVGVLWRIGGFVVLLRLIFMKLLLFIGICWVWFFFYNCGNVGLGIVVVVGFVVDVGNIMFCW